MGKIIRVDGSEEDFFPADGKCFTLSELRTAVGGWVEVITLPTGQTIVMDEEGKYTNKSKNARATLMGRVCGIAHDDFIVGDVVVCEPGELE